MLKVLKKIASNLDDFLFGVIGVVVGLAVYEYGVKQYVLKRFLKK